jgi:hypothetical protein
MREYELMGCFSCPEENACKCHVFGIGECQEHLNIGDGEAV